MFPTASLTALAEDHNDTERTGYGVWWILTVDGKAKLDRLAEKYDVQRYFLKVMTGLGHPYSLALAFDILGRKLLFYTETNKAVEALCSKLEEGIPDELQAYVGQGLADFQGFIRESHLFRILPSKKYSRLERSDAQSIFNDSEFCGVTVQRRMHEGFIIDIPDMATVRHFWELIKSKPFFWAGRKFKVLIWSNSWELWNCYLCGGLDHIAEDCDRSHCKICSYFHPEPFCPRKLKAESMIRLRNLNKDAATKLLQSISRCFNCAKLREENPLAVTWGIDHRADEEHVCQHPKMLQLKAEKQARCRFLPAWTRHMPPKEWTREYANSNREPESLASRAPRASCSIETLATSAPPTGPITGPNSNEEAFPNLHDNSAKSAFVRPASRSRSRSASMSPIPSETVAEPDSDTEQSRSASASLSPVPDEQPMEPVDEQGFANSYSAEIAAGNSSSATITSRSRLVNPTRRSTRASQPAKRALEKGRDERLEEASKGRTRKRISPSDTITIAEDSSYSSSPREDSRTLTVDINAARRLVEHHLGARKRQRKSE